jgi:hypothetical protein
MVLLGNRLKWKLDSVHLEIMLILMQDRCTVSAECTIGSEIIFVAEPPELYGPHVLTIVFQTSDSCTCEPDNSGSLSGVLGET